MNYKGFGNTVPGVVVSWVFLMIFSYMNTFKTVIDAFELL